MLNKSYIYSRSTLYIQYGPGASSPSYTKGKIKRPGRGVEYPPPSSPEDKEKVEL
jgi:hypothetical protein